MPNEDNQLNIQGMVDNENTQSNGETEEKKTQYAQQRSTVDREVSSRRLLTVGSTRTVEVDDLCRKLCPECEYQFLVGE